MADSYEQDIKRKIKKYGLSRRKRLVLIVLFIISLLIIIFRNPILDYFNFNDSSSNGIDENFPISLSSITGSNIQTDKIGDCFVILTDSYFYIYDADKGLCDSRQHTYSTAVLKTAGKKALIYESGGNKFRVDSKRKNVFEKELEQNIIFARISDEGYTAVVSNTDDAVCMLSVYDPDGSMIYSRVSVDRIIELAFTAESEGCVIVTMNCAEGQIISNAHSISFDSEQENWSTSKIETLCISAYSTSDGGLFLFGDSKCGYYDNQGQYITGYSYKNTLIDCAFSDGRAAMLFQNEQRRKTSLVLISGVDSTPVEIVIDKELKYIYTEDDTVYIMTGKSIEAYDYSGNLISTLETASAYKSFVKIDDTVFLYGYESIDCVDFES